jgi:hypothetical protein
MPGLGWRPWSSCAKFKWAGYEAIMVSDDLLLSSRSIGWVSSSFFYCFGACTNLIYLFCSENMYSITCSCIFTQVRYH